MKINATKLAQLIREELEVILTDQEANEMFGLENILKEEDWVPPRYGGGKECKPQSRGQGAGGIRSIEKAKDCSKKCRARGLEAQRTGAQFDWRDCCGDCRGDRDVSVSYAGKHGVGDWLQENNKIFAPNHYCVHHGAVQNEGVYVAAKAVNHNFNEELGCVTHYDMQIADGTVLENIAAEDILVTEASLANEHQAHMVAKRGDEEEEAPLEEADVTYIAKMLLNGLLALHKAGVAPDAILDALRGAGERERGAMVGLPGYEELPPEVQGALGADVTSHDQALGLAEEDTDVNDGTTDDDEDKVKTSYGHAVKEDSKKLSMPRNELADMIREEMARVIIIKP
tara:strand:- start:249 stop:1274 length:1026 start_codon:yes stop_codon:yes gene_type:complete